MGDLDSPMTADQKGFASFVELLSGTHDRKIVIRISLNSTM